MKKWLIFLSIVVSIVSEVPAVALSVTSQPEVLTEGPVRIIGYERSNAIVRYVQLINDSANLVNLSGWKLQGVISGQIAAEVTLSGWLPAGGYAVIGAIDGADLAFDPMLLDGMDEIRLTMGGGVAPRVVMALQNGRFELSKSSAGNYTKTSKFISVVGAAELYGGDVYLYESSTPLRVVSLLANPANCVPPATEPRCVEFVKLHNVSSEAIDLSLFRLRIGFANDTPGITNTIHLSGVLAAGEYYSVTQRDDQKPLAVASASGGVWIEDRLGLFAYPETVYDHGDISQSSHKGHAWSLNEATQKWQWSTPTLIGENNFAIEVANGGGVVNSLTPCRSDQYRSPETNRCRLKTTITAKKACMAGQYRNPETGRCKSVASVASLTPCRAGQVRNLDTNRCKSAGTTTTGYAPCAEGKERNPETNRCRTIVGAPPSAGFVPDAAQKTGEAFVGWWALGGVGTLAVGRLGWEWREEIRQAITKIPTFFTGGK